MTLRDSASRLTLILAASSLVTLSSGAQGQQAPAELSEITVTSTKRDQDPFRVDGTLETATPEDLARRGVTSTERLDRVFPDVHISQRSSRTYANVTIRGQSSVDFYNPTVQLLVDGFPQDAATLARILPPGLAGVEMLYGPQGTLYGRNAIGGVLNIVTSKPGNETRASTSIGFGTFGPQGNVWFSGPLIRDTLYGDIALSGNYDPGQYRSMATNQPLGETSEFYGRVRLRYAPTGSPWDIMLSASRSQISSGEEQFVPRAFLNQRLALPVPSHYTLNSTNIGLTASYDMGFATVTSLTGYQDRQLNRTIFGSYTPEDQTTFSQEFRIASKPAQGNVIDYVMGAYFQNLNFERRVPAANQTSRHSIQSYAVFGEATWHVTNRFDITPGVRVDVERAHAEAIGTVTLDGNKTSSAVSPKLAFGYQISDAFRAFALYSTGFKPGGFTRNISPANIAFTYNPQMTHNFEVGLKGRLLDERLFFTAAVYYNFTNDYQLFVGAQPFQYLQNVGAVTSKGFDLRLEARPIQGLRIQAGLGLNDTRFTRYSNPANPGIDLTGNRVPYAPQITANANVAYTFDLSSGWGTLTPHAGVTYVGSTYFDEYNTIGQGAYALFDAGIVWAPTAHLRTEAYINNIANQLYTVYGFNAGPGIGEVYQLGRGREVGLRMRAQF